MHPGIIFYKLPEEKYYIFSLDYDKSLIFLDLLSVNRKKPQPADFPRPLRMFSLHARPTETPSTLVYYWTQSFRRRRVFTYRPNYNDWKRPSAFTKNTLNRYTMC